MGKTRYNAKARQVVKTNIDNTQASEIQLEFSKNEYGSSDASNLLALPSKKRETKVVKDKKEKTRFLSKAQRKRLEKIVEKKKKKANRASLLESLSQVQATPDEVKQMTTISSVQTIGLRKLNELNLERSVQDVVEDSEKKYSSIAGAKKRLRLLKLDNAERVKKKKYDPNVVGLEESSEESSESDDTDNDEVEIVNGTVDTVNKTLNDDTVENHETNKTDEASSIVSKIDENASNKMNLFKESI